MKTIHCRLREVNVDKLLNYFPNKSMAERVELLILSYEERLTKKDILDYIDLKFQRFVKELEKRLKDTVGEF